MNDELKETIIREHRGGMWLVLAQEYPLEVVTADDLLCGRRRAKVIPFPLPSTAKSALVNAALKEGCIRGRVSRYALARGRESDQRRSLLASRRFRSA